ncbi:MAG: DUF433 domain-containing protein [Bryobacteraceae bacterium]
MEADFWRDCDLVEAIPGKLGGRPVIKDTRVEADLIPESIELGQTPEQIAATYRLKLKDVLGVKDYYFAQVDSAAPIR